MSAINIWVRLSDRKMSPWIEIILDSTRNVNDLKTAIKEHFPDRLKTYNPANFVLEVLTGPENDVRVVELTDSNESLASIRQRFDDKFLCVAIRVSSGKYCINRILYSNRSLLFSFNFFFYKCRDCARETKTG